MELVTKIILEWRIYVQQQKKNAINSRVVSTFKVTSEKLSVASKVI